MIVCPDCAFENIEGADLCDGCGHTLTEMSLHVPILRWKPTYCAIKLRSSTRELRFRSIARTPVADVLRTLVDHRVGCVVVTENETLVGIFSERDAFLRIGTKVADVPHHAIETYMTPDPVTLAAKDKIAFAIHKMNLGGYRHIPILTDGKLTGIISVRDILDYLAKRMFL